MNKKHVIIAAVIGVALGYILQNKIKNVPLVNKLPVLS